MKIMRIIKMAMRPAEGVAKLGLIDQNGDAKDSFLVYFIYKYENLIPWPQIKTPDQLNQYIKEKLIPNLLSKVDPDSEKNEYAKPEDVEELMERESNNPENNNQLVMGWKEAKDAGDEDMAHNYLLRYYSSEVKPIIKNKAEGFEEWWDVLSEEPFANSPSFQYSIMEPVIKASKPSSPASPLIIRKQAIEKLYNKIHDENGKANFSVKKEYQKELNPILGSENTEQDTINDKGKWKHLTGKEGRERGEDDLGTLSYYGWVNNWCVKQKNGYGGRYLLGRGSSDGPGEFYIFLENDEPKVAIRITDKNKVGEIRGYNNSVPAEYSDEILNFLDEKGIANSLDKSKLEKYAKECYGSLEKAEEVNREFREDENKRNDYISQLKSGEYIATRSPTAIIPEGQKVTLLNKEIRELPEVKEAIREGYLNQLDNTGLSTEMAGDDTRGITIPTSQKALDTLPKYLWNDEEVRDKAIETWIKNLKSHYLGVSQKNIPSKVKKTKEYKKTTSEGIINMITEGDITDEVVKKLNSINWREGGLRDVVENRFTDKYKDNPMVMERVFSGANRNSAIISFFKNKDSIKKARIEGFSKIIEKNPIEYDGQNIPDDIKSNEHIKNARIRGWAGNLKKNPEIFDKTGFPDDLKDLSENTGIREALEAGYVSKIESGATIPLRALELFPNNENIIRATKTYLLNEISKEYARFKKPGIFFNSGLVIPEEMKNDDEVIALQKGHLISVFSRNPLETFGNKASTFFPPSLREDQEIKNARASGVGFYTLKDPTYYDGHINELRSYGLEDNPIVIRDTKKGWYKELKEKPELAWKVMDYPENHFIKKYMMEAGSPLLDYMTKSIVTYFNLNASPYLYSSDFYNRLGKLPESIKKNEEVIKAYRRALAKVVSEDPWAYTNPNFPAPFKKSKSILKALNSGILRQFNGIQTETLISMDFANRFNSLPDDIKNNEEIQQGFKRALITLFGQTSSEELISPSFTQYLQTIPRAVIGDPDVFAGYKAAIGRMISKKPILFESLNPGLKQKEEIQMGLQQVKNRLIPFYRDTLNRNQPEHIRDVIMNNQDIPDFMKRDIITELGLGEVVANDSNWYKNAKNKKVYQINSLKDMINIRR